jgi:23S rRNA (cytosine1962-C5)-methyltransferase
MERQKEAITDAIVKVLSPRQLWWKNDAGIRAMEQLPEYADLGYGEYGGEVVAKEGGLEFGVDPVGGQ